MKKTLFFLIGWMWLRPIYSQNITVTSSGGGLGTSPMTLRSALQQIGDGDTIQFDALLNNSIIDISQDGTLDLPQNIAFVIDASGLNITLDAGQADRVFDIAWAGNTYHLTLYELTLKNASKDNKGGTIELPPNSTLKMYRCTTDNSYGTDSGGAITNVSVSLGISGICIDTDGKAPVITEVEDGYVKILNASTWEAPQISASDELDGDVSSKIQVSYTSFDADSSVTDLATARSHLATPDNTIRVIYNVADLAGNQAVSDSATFTAIDPVTTQTQYHVDIENGDDMNSGTETALS